jgi:hypothetical protein
MECIRERFARLQQSVLPRELRDKIFSKPWVVYAKRPFGGPEQVIEYLGRYTHKIAISNHRLQSIDAESVTFTFKDYKDHGKKKTMCLNTEEFVRRFSLHILPKRFVRIRHYGILSSTAKRAKFQKVKDALKQRVRKQKHKLLPERKTYNPLICSCCHKETMVRVLDFDFRGPPPEILKTLSIQKKTINENTGSKKTA